MNITRKKKGSTLANNGRFVALGLGVRKHMSERNVSKLKLRSNGVEKGLETEFKQKRKNNLFKSDSEESEDRGEKN